jgi:N-acetylglucosaminyl-diphospho-decaprenol L-rhamnosyltransferase
MRDATVQLGVQQQTDACGGANILGQVPSTASTLIVTWNNRDFLGRCLESLPKDSEIVVVDNASTDGSADFVAETFPHVRLIRLDRNIGFGAAINRAAAEATGTYLLLLNPDAEATPKSIERLMEFLDEHITCGAAAGRLLSMTEDWQRGFNVRRLPTYGTVIAHLLLFKHVWPSNPLTRHAEAAEITDTATQAVEQPAAACLMVRRRTFDQVGGMDERFFPAWFEDVDLCRRILEAGWTIFFVPRANFRHLGGVSVAALGVPRTKRLYYQNLERYMGKHHGLMGRAITRSLIVTGMGLRVTGSALVGNGEGMRTYSGVLRAALGGWKEPG